MTSNFNVFLFFFLFFFFVFCFLFHTPFTRTPAIWVLLHLLFIHHFFGPWLIGTYCIYPKSEQTVLTQRRTQNLIRVVTECHSDSLNNSEWAIQRRSRWDCANAQVDLDLHYSNAIRAHHYTSTEHFFVFMFSMLSKNISRQYFEIFSLFFPENRIWHFM